MNIYRKCKPSLIILLFTFFDLSAQKNELNGIFNTNGFSFKHQNLQLDINIGESILVNTFINNNYIFSNGFLQGFIDRPPYISKQLNNWFPSEIKIHPNPVINFVEINFLTMILGKVVYTVYDDMGYRVLTQKIDYKWLGLSDKINLGYLKSGIYYLKITLNDFGTNKEIKSGVWKLMKI